MKYLVTLFTPPGGTVLDPFAGSFTTGVAAILLDFGIIAIEKTAAYVPIGQAKMSAAIAQVLAAEQERLAAAALAALQPSLFEDACNDADIPAERRNETLEDRTDFAGHTHDENDADHLLHDNEPALRGALTATGTVSTPGEDAAADLRADMVGADGPAVTDPAGDPGESPAEEG